MRFLYACFEGYIGFYNGMNLEKLEIDFTRCKHNITVITGLNGCGKSTLMNALNIFPDNSSCYRVNIDAQKILRLQDRDTIYDILIQSPSDGRGGRKVTKAFISRNGVELNPNGNVSSYKEILSSEFDLDSNFIGLSILSSVDRGLGDKKPAERKKFVGSVIDNLLTYNNIYKTLNKKALLYKSHINTLQSRIQSTGDKNVLEPSLNQLLSQESTINDKIMAANNTIVAIRAKNSIDEDEAKIINELNSQKTQISADLSKLLGDVESYTNKTKISVENIAGVKEEHERCYNKYLEDYNNYNTEWREKSDSLARVTSTINQLEATIAVSNSDIDNELEKKYFESNNLLETLKNDMDKLGIPLDLSLRKEISDIIEFYGEFITKVDVLYDGLNRDQLLAIVNEDPIVMISKYKTKSDVICNSLDTLQAELLELQIKLKTVTILDNRPKNCKIDTCPFIQEAITINKTSNKKQLLDAINDVQEKLLKLSDNLTETQEFIDFYNSIVSKKMEYRVLTDLYFKIKQRYPNSRLIDSKLEDIGNRVIEFYHWNELRNPDKLVEALNVLDQYEYESNNNSIIKASYEAHREKIQLINSTRATIESMKKEQEELNKDIIDLRGKADHTKSLVDEFSRSIGIEQLYLDAIEAYNKKKEELDDVLEKLEVYNKKSSKALESLTDIENLQNDINRYQNELIPIRNSISDIRGRLTLLESYYAEYNEYNQSYTIIETLKKYCSPTAGGIQTVFMQIYMSKTLELSNQILGMLFGGEYRLLDFVINENEFRIPFIGNGLAVDDISSGSNSQICMMGMVINLVLLKQASTKFNIAYLDEIDAGLDHRNRFEFVDALYKSIPILGIDQLFMISHSMETDTSAVDIIKLKSYADFEDTVTLGNVIYDYNEEVKKA